MAEKGGEIMQMCDRGERERERERLYKCVTRREKERVRTIIESG